MKKVYTKPTTETVVVKTECSMLTGSGTFQKATNVDVQMGDNEDVWE